MTRNLTICLHAWRHAEYGDQEYSDASSGEHVDGWTVYVREETPQDPQQPFDIPEEADFATYEEAAAHARDLSARLGLNADDVHEY